jgi:SAM-dependent methyltransferase
MDGPGVSEADYRRCLHDLAQVNRVTFTHAATLKWLARAIDAQPPPRPVSIMDVAYGDGDLLRAIGRWAARRGLAVALQGIDLNPKSAPAARAATPPELTIDYRTGDVFADAPRPRPDFIVSSQFTHHLSDADVVRFLRWLETHAARGWFIADLQRHVIPYYAFRWLCRIAGWHRIVRLDGTVSIARSFRRAEWQALLEQAGIAADVRWLVPFRLGVGRIK